MSKLGLGMQIDIAFFILFLLINVIASYGLIRVKKNEYPELWEKDKKKAHFWRTAEQYVLEETAMRPKPEWLTENKNARFLLLIYWLSFLAAMCVLVLPVILALVFGIYLF
jgi:hypothetical protein